MKTFFIELYAYNHHFNQKILKVCRERPDQVSEKSIQLFGHLLNAHHIWNERILHREITTQTWDVHSFDDLNHMEEENNKLTLNILDTHDLNVPISYRMGNGIKRTNTLHDILFHTINHSTYHRGQIATEFRTSGIAPLLTDYIAYKWL